jgi:hypothetical protein
MNEHRTLTQSLQKSKLSEAQIAFVAGDVAKREGTTRSATELPSLSEQSDRSLESLPVGVGASVSVTIRLPGDLASRLLEVSLNRKLRREKPFTQQDIVADALGQWLKNQSDSL